MHRITAVFAATLGGLRRIVWDVNDNKIIYFTTYYGVYMIIVIMEYVNMAQTEN
ncbi:MAG: hypothetical protein K2J60_11395 [Acetatifactor sp.]|nr:hypothetical protein [Acetatifactor sp.]